MKAKIYSFEERKPQHDERILVVRVMYDHVNNKFGFAFENVRAYYPSFDEPEKYQKDYYYLIDKSRSFMKHKSSADIFCFYFLKDEIESTLEEFLRSNKNIY